MKELIEKLVQTAEGEKIQRFVVGAIITKGNKILCLKRAGHDFLPGLYELPSGKTKASERLDEALIREVKEESNLTVTKLVKYMGDFDYVSQSGIKTRQFTFLVSVNPTDNVMLNPQEHEGYAWVTQQEMQNYRISPEVKFLMDKYFTQETTKDYANNVDVTIFSEKKRGQPEEPNPVQSAKVQRIPSPTLNANGDQE